MKLTKTLLTCPTTFRLRSINNYYTKCHTIFENILFNLNLRSSEEKNYNFNNLTNSSLSKNRQIQQICNYLRITSQTTFKPFTDCRFISDELMHNLLTKHTLVRDITAQHNSNKIMMRLYSTYDDSRCFNQSLDIANKFTKIFSLLELLNVKNKTIHIYYAPVDIPKLMPHNKHFGVNNINSGGTIHTLSQSLIVLFRKEESDKVLIHELIHYLRLDFSMSDIYLDNAYDISNQVIDEFNVSRNYSKINLFEALTDCLGIIFNSIFNCILTKSDINDYFYTEYCYCLSVANRIIKKSGFKNTNHFLDKGDSLYLDQSTSVLAYYILKCSLMNNTDTVLTKYFPKYNFEWNLRDIHEFYKLTKKDLYLIQKILANPTINNSLRMTYNDLNYYY